MTNEELVVWVKRQLGYPVVQVEVPDESIKMCIEDAINEVMPWYSSTKYITVPVTGTCIDLSDYSIREVISVRKSDEGTTGSLYNEFFPNEISVTGASNLLSVRLEYMLANQMAGYYKDNLSYDYIDNKLYIDMYPSSTSITIEYIPNVESIVEITDIRFINYIKNFTLAFTRLILSQIRGKFRVSNSPVELDYDSQLESSRNELERLRQSIKDEFMDDCITD